MPPAAFVFRIWDEVYGRRYLIRRPYQSAQTVSAYIYNCVTAFISLHEPYPHPYISNQTVMISFSLISSSESSFFEYFSSSFCDWVSPSFDSSSGMPSF